MMRRQYSLAKLRMSETPDVSLLEGVVLPKVLDAMRVASAKLSELGIRHVLVGGLAVGAYGYPRFSKDVDFLVGEEAFEHHAGGIVSIVAGVPIQVEDVIIDQILPKANQRHLFDAIGRGIDAGGIPIIPVEALVYMKLDSPRRKDSVDVVELLKAGIDAVAAREYLEQHAPELLAKFKTLLDEANAE